MSESAIYYTPQSDTLYFLVRDGEKERMGCLVQNSVRGLHRRSLGPRSGRESRWEQYWPQVERELEAHSEVRSVVAVC